jgi:hypothetical protein
VTFIDPVAALFAPLPAGFPPDVAVTLPVIFITPELVLFTPCTPVELPDVTFPVIVRVPDPRFEAPIDPTEVPPDIFPTTKPSAGDAAENSKQVEVPLAATIAVMVMPSGKTNFPVPALLISSHVVLTLIVTVCPVLARASSPTPGTTPPTHVAPALKLPLAADTMSAMAYSPFA